MTMHGDVMAGQALILFEPKIGYVWGWAIEAKPDTLGTSALLGVTVNSKNLPGVERLVVSVNVWDVWDAKDPEVLIRVARDTLPKEWERER